MAAKRYPEDAYQKCVRIVHGNGERDLQYRADKKHLAMVTDGSGYAASFNVLPTFGCVLHEATPDSGAARKEDT